MTTIDDVELPMQKTGAFALSMFSALAVTGFLLVMTFAGGWMRHAAAFKATLLPTLAPDSQEELPVPALAIHPGPAQGTYSELDSAYLCAEPERIRSEEASSVANDDPDVIDPTTAALRNDRYGQYLADRGYVRIEDLRLRERTIRDGQGRVIGKSLELVAEPAR